MHHNFKQVMKGITIMLTVLKRGLIMMMCLTTGLIAAIEDVSLGGSYLGGVNYFKQGAGIRSGFDCAIKLDIGFQLSERISGGVQLQGGAGNGPLGFVGPEAAVTDLFINYTCDKGYDWTFGSFDTPFGADATRLTNNADATATPFILNPLLYSSFAGPVGTLNTLGVMGQKAYDWGDITVALTNGTGENAVNDGNGFEGVLGYGKRGLFGGLLDMSATLLSSRDGDDAGNDDSDSFKVDLDAYVVDAAFNIDEDLTARVAVSRLSYDDGNSGTEDDVMAYSVEAIYLIGEDMDLGLRYSLWQPEDDNGSGAGMSTGISNPGLSTTGIADTSVQRLQAALTIAMEENVDLKTEVFLDQSDAGSDVGGIAIYLNGSF